MQGSGLAGCLVPTDWDSICVVGGPVWPVMAQGAGAEGDMARGHVGWQRQEGVCHWCLRREFGI